MKITVITATLNNRDTVDECLESVCMQKEVTLEHIVVDGASVDGTYELLKKRKQQITKFVSEPDQGIYDALNKGIKLATGDVIGFLHGDDFYPQEDVLKNVAACFSTPTVDAVYGDLDYVSRTNSSRILRRWQPGNFKEKKLRKGWMVPHPTLFVRRKWYEKLKGYDTRYKIAADYHFILRLFSQERFNPHYLPQVLVKMRHGGMSNRNLLSMARKSREDLLILRRTGVGGVGALIWKNLSKLGQFQSS